MVLLGIIVPMIFLVFLGRKRATMGMREYLIIVLVALLQTAIVSIAQFTKQPPPPLP
jgi:hypothetical protein